MGHPRCRCIRSCKVIRMKYRHTITGAVVDFKGKISGAWEPVEASKAPAKVETKEEVKDAPAQKKRGSKK